MILFLFRSSNANANEDEVSIQVKQLVLMILMTCVKFFFSAFDVGTDVFSLVTGTFQVSWVDKKPCMIDPNNTAGFCPSDFSLSISETERMWSIGVPIIMPIFFNLIQVLHFQPIIIKMMNEAFKEPTPRNFVIKTAIQISILIWPAWYFNILILDTMFKIIKARSGDNHQAEKNSSEISRICNRASMGEVCLESSFQPLIQLHLIFLGVMGTDWNKIKEAEELLRRSE